MQLIRALRIGAGRLEGSLYIPLEEGRQLTIHESTIDEHGEERKYPILYAVWGKDTRLHGSRTFEILPDGTTIYAYGNPWDEKD